MHEDDHGACVGLGVEMVGEGDGHGESALWAVGFELLAIEGEAEKEGGDEGDEFIHD